MKGHIVTSMWQALRDPAYFAGVMARPSCENWNVLLDAACPDPEHPKTHSPREFEILKRFTGRSKFPKQMPSVVALRVGRRGGKDMAAGVAVSWIAGRVDWRQVITRPGEVGTIMVLANSKEQAVESFKAIKGTLEQSPILRKMITNITVNTIILAKQRVQIIVCAADQATVRGYTLLAVWLSEFAHFTSNENFETYDLELLRSLKPGFFSTKGTISNVARPGIFVISFRI
jgi:hypothetical protein